jgi:hypothetical protein
MYVEVTLSSTLGAIHSKITPLTNQLSPTSGPISLQLPSILHPANSKHNPPTLKRLLLQRSRL